MALFVSGIQRESRSREIQNTYFQGAFAVWRYQKGYRLKLSQKSRMWILTDWALAYRNTDSKLCAKNGLYSQGNLTKRNDSGLNATEELTKTMQLDA